MLYRLGFIPVKLKGKIHASLPIMHTRDLILKDLIFYTLSDTLSLLHGLFIVVGEANLFFSSRCVQFLTRSLSRNAFSPSLFF